MTRDKKDTDMRVAYISGPLRATEPDAVCGPFTPEVLWQHTLAARTVARILWAKGYAVICPHMNTFMMDGAPVIDFIGGDCAIISRLRPDYDLFVLLPGWEFSEGSRRELEAAKARRLIVIDLDTFFLNPSDSALSLLSPYERCVKRRFAQRLEYELSKLKQSEEDADE